MKAMRSWDGSFAGAYALQRDRESSEHPELMKTRGANFNGTTWYDRTNYYETLRAEGDNLEFAIRLEADEW